MTVLEIIDIAATVSAYGGYIAAEYLGMQHPCIRTWVRTRAYGPTYTHT